MTAYYTSDKDHADYWKGVAERALAKQSDYESALLKANTEISETIACNGRLVTALKAFADLGVGSGPDYETETYKIERGAIKRARSAISGTNMRQETTSEHIARDIREGRFPKQSERKMVDENDCPGHVASKADAKVCAHCGTHIDSLRPDDLEQ